MPFLIGLAIVFVIFFFIEKGWNLGDGWAMRATIITIGIGVGGFILLCFYFSFFNR